VRDVRLAHELDETGNVMTTGRLTDWPVDAVNRAVGYLSQSLPGLPFDLRHGTVPNCAGRVQTLNGTTIDGVYVTGWIKRGPVGLIGHTKGDASERCGTCWRTQPDSKEPRRRPRPPSSTA
jgi:ferredoxin--NADP+ reductase